MYVPIGKSVQLLSDFISPEVDSFIDESSIPPSVDDKALQSKL